LINCIVFIGNVANINMLSKETTQFIDEVLGCFNPVLNELGKGLRTINFAVTVGSPLRTAHDLGR
jgi:hypothetical protein